MGTKLEHVNNPLESYCGGESIKKRKMLQPHNIESIKKTLLIHEDIFKHQVKELHRLYRVQKMLMDELKLKINRTKMWDQHQQISRDDLECSGSCSGDTPRIPRGFDLERPAEEDFSVVRINGSNEDCTKIELTLTMGCNSAAIKRERRENYSERDNIAMANSSSATLNQENSSQRHWLFQDLKLG